MKKYLFSLLTLMMVATVSFVFASCGDDDDDPNFVGEWVACNSKGEIADEDGSDPIVVAHLLLRQDGTGENWTTYSDGEEKGLIGTFRYIISYNGKTGTLSILYTSFPDASVVGTEAIYKFTYENGILHLETTNQYYKKK